MIKNSILQIKENLNFDFLIIGGGIAGASLSLKLATIGKVALVCKKNIFSSNTNLAQGGISAVLAANDSFENHISDTLNAGAGLCHPHVVQKVIEAAPLAIAELANLGVKFSLNADLSYHLHREGGHSARRVVHANDSTGGAIQQALAAQITRNENIILLENHFAIDLIVSDKISADFSQNRVLGAYILDETNKAIFSIIAHATVLATGGHGKLYLYTSNPDISSGDGIAMAWRAGARVANLEFMQFHPTCLYHAQVKNFLISEALRGEGAILLNQCGERFMENMHPMQELAPRDIVARSIDSEMKKSGASHVLLDFTHKDKDFIQTHFPAIYSKCLELGLDISKSAIPVVPAAHYSCGGVLTDLYGHTGVPCLWALGEVACTGLHGANRLASNSLLEGIAFAQFVFTDIKAKFSTLQRIPKIIAPQWRLGKAAPDDEMVIISQLWDEIRSTMWNYVGIVRSDKRLELAAVRIAQINLEIDSYYWNIVPSSALIEVRNLALVAKLSIQCARLRKESRGTHYSLDYPSVDDIYHKKDTVLLY